jgi:hypothetical protein
MTTSDAATEERMPRTTNTAAMLRESGRASE